MKKTLFALSTALLFSCGAEKPEPKEIDHDEKKNVTEDESPKSSVKLSDFDFMQGMWFDNSENSDGFHEKWVRQSDTLMQVIGCYISGKDTAIMESIKVMEINGRIFYIPLVTDQNNGEEIRFKMDNGSTADSIIFTNYKHDFPREIIYVKRDSAFVEVYLFGVDKDSIPKNYYLPLTRKE